MSAPRGLTDPPNLTFPRTPGSTKPRLFTLQRTSGPSKPRGFTQRTSTPSKSLVFTRFTSRNLQHARHSRNVIRSSAKVALPSCIGLHTSALQNAKLVQVGSSIQLGNATLTELRIVRCHQSEYRNPTHFRTSVLCHESQYRNPTHTLSDLRTVLCHQSEYQNRTHTTGPPYCTVSRQ